MAKPPVAGMVVVTDDGRWLELATSIARGGEGSIHPVVDDPATLAKIFTHPERRADQRADKLRWMTRTPAPAGDGWACAWPTALLLDADAALIGFLMPHIADGISLRAASDPEGDATARWNPADRLRIAARLATAVADLHDRGHLLCDISPDNVLVRPGGDLVLIDVDAFAVLADAGPPPVTYGSTSWRAAYSPPEVSAALGRLERLPHHDDYALAVCLYTWLMEGRHPFQGRVPAGQRSVPATDAMREGWFPQATVPGSPLLPPPVGPRFDTLPPALQALFRQCFVDAHADRTRRPAARAWAAALTDAGAALRPAKRRPAAR